MATVNQQIDALLKRRGNPAPKIESDVRRFTRMHGIKISPKPGKLPLLSKGEWVEVFDGWQDAHDFLLKSQRAYQDKGTAFPWDRKKNPTRKPRTAARSVVLVAAKNPRKTDKRLRVNRPVQSSEWLRFKVQEKRSESGPWVHTAGFHKKSDAETYAKALHALRPDMFFRVFDPS